MKDFLKAVGLFLLVAFFLALMFGAVVGIGSMINNVSFYDQLRLWFGSSSGFAKLLN